MKVTAKSLNYGGLFGPEIKLLIENDSGKDLTFQCRNASVNGYMIGTMMSVDVASGKKADGSLTFADPDLEASGVGTIADMEFSLHIFATEDREGYLDTPPIRLETDAAGTYGQAFDDSGDPVYEGGGIRIISKGLSEDRSVLGPGIMVYIENGSDKDVTVQVRNVSVNGFMADAVFSANVPSGKRAVDAITFLSSDLEKNGSTISTRWSCRSTSSSPPGGRRSWIPA